MSLTLQELFTDLSHGELSNLHMGAEGSGAIEETKQPKIVLYTNEGLLKLHSRFCLIEKDLNLELVGHITNYHFLRKFAESNRDPKQKYLYIKDLLCEPFIEDVIRVLTVYNKMGDLLPLNDTANACSVFTPQPQILQVPNPIQGMSLSIGYQARHPKITGEDLEQRIELPDTLHVALTSYIAYNVYCTISTAEATAKAQEHLLKYETTCQEVEDKDLVSTSSSSTNVRFRKNGWI